MGNEGPCKPIDPGIEAAVPFFVRPPGGAPLSDLVHGGRPRPGGGLFQRIAMGPCAKIRRRIYIDFVVVFVVSAYFMFLDFFLYFSNDGFRTLLVTMLVLTQDYRAGGG